MNFDKNKILAKPKLSLMLKVFNNPNFQLTPTMQEKLLNEVLRLRLLLNLPLPDKDIIDGTTNTLSS
jgi:hypothetical protein